MTTGSMGIFLVDMAGKKPKAIPKQRLSRGGSVEENSGFL
uniref:Uncharacterized protein n=1 Tax=Nelumbo nucifera TaxID=4432 RepID=A0A822XZZ1_NELNU|nr:TPA_asm: hypothetical protein HUJ06_027408 [Nelumbo nucifera]